MYDKDRSGGLDKEECKDLIKEVLQNYSGDADNNDEEFEEVFSIFDRDNSGVIDKTEIIEFIKQFIEWIACLIIK